MKKIFYFTTIIGLLFTFVSCEQDDGVAYELTDKVEASFPSTVVNYQMIAEDGNKIVVEMWRGNTKGAATVPVTVTDNTNGVFTPEKEQFDFAAGENKAYLTFTYPDINQFGGEKYEIELTIDEEMVSPGGNGTIKISAQRKLTFKSLGTGTFTTEFFGESWAQEVMKAEEADYYRLPDCYYGGYHIEFSIQDGEISFARQPMGYVHSDYGMVHFTMPRDEYTQPNRDGNVFNLYAEFTVAAGSFGLFQEVLVLP